MKRNDHGAIERWLPLSRRMPLSEDAPTGEAFRIEWIDFKRGIRVGNIAPHERITRILKHHLETAYATPFVTDKWGRGEFWQWICWLPRANREAKPISRGVNFGCAKLFITADSDPPVFKSGLQVERGYAEGPAPYPGCALAPDWDWHRLADQCADGTELDRELGRLLRHEGFTAELGDWENNAVFTAANYRSARQLHDALAACPANDWVGFQLYYPMTAKEVRACSGLELVRAVVAVFKQVMPAMNAVMQIKLEERATQDQKSNQSRPAAGRRMK